MHNKSLQAATLTIALLACFTGWCHAQGMGEWFNQKQTQTKYLIQQIAALQVYIQYLEKGYRITRSGLSLIGDIKNGTFILHKDYFNRLKAINPEIMKYPKIAGILSMQMGLLSRRRTTIKLSQQSHQLSTEEMDYIQKVFDNVESEALKDLDELQLVITGGQMQMTDDERITQIDLIYHQLQEKYSFTQTFGGHINRLLEQRARGEREALDLWSMYGMPLNKEK